MANCGLVDTMEKAPCCENRREANTLSPRRARRCKTILHPSPRGFGIQSSSALPLPDTGRIMGTQFEKSRPHIAPQTSKGSARHSVRASTGKEKTTVRRTTLTCASTEPRTRTGALLLIATAGRATMRMLSGRGVESITRETESAYRSNETSGTGILRAFASVVWRRIACGLRGGAPALVLTPPQTSEPSGFDRTNTAPSLGVRTLSPLAVSISSTSIILLRSKMAGLTGRRTFRSFVLAITSKREPAMTFSGRSAPWGPCSFCDWRLAA